MQKPNDQVDRLVSVDRDTVSRRRHLGPIPCEDLRSSLYGLQVQTSVEPMIRLQVSVEIDQVSVEVGGSLALGHEAVHDGVAIAPLDEVERRRADGRGRDWGGRVSVVGERADVAIDAQPDHYLVGLRA